MLKYMIIHLKKKRLQLSVYNEKKKKHQLKNQQQRNQESTLDSLLL